MKNLLKFLLLVLVLSAGVSLLYDYQLRHGRLNLTDRSMPGKIHARGQSGGGFEADRESCFIE